MKQTFLRKTLLFILTLVVVFSGTSLLIERAMGRSGRGIQSLKQPTHAELVILPTR